GPAPASPIARRPPALGGLASADARLEGGRVARAVVDAVREGCIAETLAAHEAACLAGHADDPQVAAILRRIADDEARHAALAWRFVAWALDTRPELHSLAERAFAIDLQPASARASSTARPDQLGFGCPSAELRARWREVGLRELVWPCAARLLVATRRTAPARSPAPASSTAPAPRR